MKTRYFAFAVIEAETMRDACIAMKRDMEKRLAEIDERFEQGMGESRTVEEFLEAMTDAHDQHAVIRAGAGARVDVVRHDDPIQASLQLHSWGRQIAEWAEETGR
jgi:hypothetical protein